MLISPKGKNALIVLKLFMIVASIKLQILPCIMKSEIECWHLFIFSQQISLMVNLQEHQELIGIFVFFCTTQTWKASVIPCQGKSVCFLQIPFSWELQTLSPDSLEASGAKQMYWCLSKSCDFSTHGSRTWHVCCHVWSQMKGFC